MHVGSRMGAILKRVAQNGQLLHSVGKKANPSEYKQFCTIRCSIWAVLPALSEAKHNYTICVEHIPSSPLFVQTVECGCLPSFRFCLWTDCALQLDFHLSPLRTRMLKHDCFHSWRLLGLVPHAALMSFTPSTRPSWQWKTGSILAHIFPLWGERGSRREPWLTLTQLKWKQRAALPSVQCEMNPGSPLWAVSLPRPLSWIGDVRGTSTLKFTYKWPPGAWGSKVKGKSVSPSPQNLDQTLSLPF